MFSQKRLLSLIDTDMRLCRAARPIDESGKQHQVLEMTTLTTHQQWAQRAGDDQTLLGQVVESLEKSVVVGYQRWREFSTVKQ
jgi:hypothetical protein